VTAHRRPAIRYSDAPRGTCRWCGEPILHAEGDRAGQVNLRRRWHRACVDVYNATDPREARRIVRKRDRGVCAVCRLDTKKLKKEIQGRGSAKKLRAKGFVPRRSLWELDHVVPLIDGGGHGLENLQTLCTPCHKAKTATEARARSRVAADTRTPAATTRPEPAKRPAQRDAKLDTLLDPLLEEADAVNARIEKALAEFTPSAGRPTPAACDTAPTPPIR